METWGAQRRWYTAFNSLVLGLCLLCLIFVPLLGPVFLWLGSSVNTLTLLFGLFIDFCSYSLHPKSIPWDSLNFIQLVLPELVISGLEVKAVQVEKTLTLHPQSLCMRTRSKAERGEAKLFKYFLFLFLKILTRFFSDYPLVIVPVQ